MRDYLFLVTICLLMSCAGNKVTTTARVDHLSIEKEILKHQEALQVQYKDPMTSPLKELAVDFKGHSFFPIKQEYRVEATFSRFENEEFFNIQTSGPKTPAYRKFGLLKFNLNGKAYELTVLQNRDNLRNPLYRKHLFLAFTDLTNGQSTYGGGRYIDLEIPTGETIILDFNKSYNPYCAYTTGYSCPIPPEENFLDLELKAGIMLVK